MAFFCQFESIRFIDVMGKLDQTYLLSLAKLPIILMSLEKCGLNINCYEDIINEMT